MPMLTVTFITNREDSHLENYFAVTDHVESNAFYSLIGERHAQGQQTSKNCHGTVLHL